VIPVELEIRNFLAYRNPPVLSFEGMHVACLAGPNGAGKSSLLDAMTWALWGRARSNSPDELIHQGEREMRVALTFDHAGSRYRVIRQRKAGKQGASLLELQVWDSRLEGWRSLSEGSMRGTQEKIETILRLDYETFINSAFLMQGRADEFTTKTPTQRKQVLATILGLERWEVYEDRVKKRISETEGEIQRLEGRLEEIERELAKREQYEAELTAAEQAATEAGAKLAELEKRWSEIERARSERTALQRQMDDLTRRIAAKEGEVAETARELARAQARADKASLMAALDVLQKQLADLGTVQASLHEAMAARTALRERVAELKGVNQTLGPQTEPVKARLATLESSTAPICPTCGQPLSEAHRLKLLEELRQDIEERRRLYRDNQAEIKSLDGQGSPLDGQIAEMNEQLREHGEISRRAGELQAALAHADEAADQVAVLKERSGRWSEELRADHDALARLEQMAALSDERLKASSLLQRDLDRARLDKRVADERVGGARQRLAALEAYALQREQRLAEREELTDNLALYRDLREAFSKRGVPAMIIETAVPELENAANQLLARLSDGQLHLRIETQKETKAGDVREALEILISDLLGTRPYELYSGGEAFRINFAIRIALSRLLARRAGAQLRSLFIDEGFGTQDDRGREHLVAAINSIQDDFDRILVITHIEELKEAFPARIEVTKTPQGSEFRLM
jgi:exonuclease SbcC